METSPLPVPADEVMPESGVTPDTQKTPKQTEIDLPRTEAAELTFQENSFVKDAIEKQPETVFQHVVKAAEEGEPIEAQFERRQEVKDEETSGAVPIGSVIAGTSYPTTVDKPPINPPAIFDFPAANEPGPITFATSTYKRAMLRGFSLGLGIIAFTIIYILLR